MWMQNLGNEVAECFGELTPEETKQIDEAKSAMKEEYTKLKASLDEAIEYLADDELLEVTPEKYRIRKRILNQTERGRAAKRAKVLLEA